MAERKRRKKDREKKHDTEENTVRGNGKGGKRISEVRTWERITRNVRKKRKNGFVKERRRKTKERGRERSESGRREKEKRDRAGLRDTLLYVFQKPRAISPYP